MPGTTQLRDIVRVTEQPVRQPDGLESRKHAADAWQVWQKLTRRRASPSLAGEFAAHEHEGVPGYQWTGNMADAVALHLGAGHGHWPRNAIRQWLTETGNAANLAGPGPQSAWWFAAEWQDVSPATRHRALRRDAAPADGSNTAGPYPCAYCERPFLAQNDKAKHERRLHADLFTASARYLCQEGDGVTGACGYPANDTRSIGRHLATIHSITSESQRRAAIRRAEAAAGYGRQSRLAAADAAAVADDDMGETAQPGPLADTTAAPVPAQPAGTEAPLPGPELPAAPLAGPEAADTNPAVTAAGALAGLRDIEAYLQGAAAREQDLAAQLAAARQEAADARARENRFAAMAGPLLDLMTTRG
jgi:hypothetical protein